MSSIRVFFDRKVCRAAIFLGCIGLLFGCNSYQVSETILNEELENHLMSQSKPRVFVDIGEQFATLDMFITGISIDLMAKNGGTAEIHLSTNTTGKFVAFSTPIPVSTHLGLTVSSGLIVKNGKIYLANPAILAVNVQGTNVDDNLLRSILGPFNKDFERALAGYFYQHPIYELMHSSFEESTKSGVKDIRIKEDKLLLTFY